MRVVTKTVARRIAAVLAAGVAAAGIVVAVGGSAPSRQVSRPARPTKIGAFAGYLWAGYVITVRASWKVPRILAGSPYGSAGTWIDAQEVDGHGPFIQIGTNEEKTDYGPGGFYTPTKYYTAFWSDTTLHDQPQLLFYVPPGDRISASLKQAAGHWLLNITDSTSGTAQSLSTHDETDELLDQADWLQEHVMSARDNYGYPRLSAVTFRHLAVDSAAPSPDTLQSASMSLHDTPDIQPTPLASDSFTVGVSSVAQ
jgi:hypothetical protein